VGLLALSAPAAALGCGEDCSNANCGTGVFVWWMPGDIPDAVAHQLCVDDACEPVEPHTGAGGGVLSVAPSSGTTASDVVVRLELLDDRGRVTDVLAGGGTKSGGCCPGIELRATEAGSLEPESISSR
jgi:hypothetical protein